PSSVDTSLPGKSWSESGCMLAPLAIRDVGRVGLVDVGVGRTDGLAPTGVLRGQMHIVAGFPIGVHSLPSGTLVVGDPAGQIPIGLHECTVVRVHGAARASSLSWPIVRPTAACAVPAHIRRPLPFAYDAA